MTEPTRRPVRDLVYVPGIGARWPEDVEGQDAPEVEAEQESPADEQPASDGEATDQSITPAPALIPIKGQKGSGQRRRRRADADTEV